MNMQTKTLVIAVVIIAATAALAIAPLAISNAMAAPNGDVRCVHNGNGADKCTGGNSATKCTKTNGKYVCE
jgi:hypothetical protein